MFVSPKNPYVEIPVPLCDGIFKMRPLGGNEVLVNGVAMKETWALSD